MDVTTGRLTTHVLDVQLGRPAAGLIIELWHVAAEPVKLKTTVTNSDGRVDEPLLQGAALKTGIYELRFRAGDYLHSVGASLSSPPFLDVIPIRFGIASAAQHYHVPLLLAANGYSTYRGS
ncbi:MAG: hydroxyisourate hydrolase [Phyllobacteriaceae bacterium]|jgi:5-hydroxyisourate hydrolase|nr:hydroxyisourate hydrolase [Phyllobacteriaceae bacterium]